jgi:hypothetical protein
MNIRAARSTVFIGIEVRENKKAWRAARQSRFSTFFYVAARGGK